MSRVQGKKALSSVISSEKNVNLLEKIIHEKYGYNDTLYKNNAMYYHANYINPGWHLTKVTQIGNHIFYR